MSALLLIFHFSGFLALLLVFYINRNSLHIPIFLLPFPLLYGICLLFPDIAVRPIKFSLGLPFIIILAVYNPSVALGLSLMALGIFLNFLVLWANGMKMPLATSHLEEWEAQYYLVMNESTHLNVLGDWLLGDFSIGDVFTMVGPCVALYSSLRPH